REFLLCIAERLGATRRDAPLGAYACSGELLDDLRTAQRSLAVAGAAPLAYGELQRVIWLVQTFGFHLAELEIRQHSQVHERGRNGVRAGGPVWGDPAEVLATLRVMGDIQRRHGVDACRRYVISFTRDAGDVAAVYELADHAMAALD